MTLPKVRLFLLGGTITMEKTPARKTGTNRESGGVVPAVDAAALCRAAPGLAQIARVEPRTDRMVASSNLSYADGLTLAAEIRQAATSGEADGFVVVQGTDTLEEMAFLLDCLLDIAAPVVVTGAMRSPGQPGADGPANLLAAVACAATKSLGRAGVVVVLNDDIHSARYVSKSHTADVGAFQSPNMGPIGRLVEGRARLFALPAAGVKLTWPDMAEKADIPRVPLIRATFGDDGFLLDLLADAECQGVVFEGFGAGHAPEKFIPALEKLGAKMPVVLASRVAAGHVHRRTYGFAGSEIDLIGRGLIPSGHLDGLKAKVLLSLLLITGAGDADIRRAFDSRDL